MFHSVLKSKAYRHYQEWQASLNATALRWRVRLQERVRAISPLLRLPFGIVIIFFVQDFLWDFRCMDGAWGMQALVDRLSNILRVPFGAYIHLVLII